MRSFMLRMSSVIPLPSVPTVQDSKTGRFDEMHHQTGLSSSFDMRRLIVALRVQTETDLTTALTSICCPTSSRSACSFIEAVAPGSRRSASSCHLDNPRRLHSKGFHSSGLTVDTVCKDSNHKQLASFRTMWLPLHVKE